MPLYRYEAINTAGKVITGMQQGEIAQDVEQWLFNKELTPVDIQVAPEGGALGGTSKVDTKVTLLDKWRGVPLEDLLLFCQQMSAMLIAGVALLRSLQIMKQQISNPILRQHVNEIADDIEAGLNLSDAIAKHPKVFSQLFVNLVRIGEETGNLDNTFAYLASLFENEKDINEKIKSVTSYPKFVSYAMIAAVVFLMRFVVPKFLVMFASSKTALPLATRMLIGVSDFFSDHFLAAIVAGVAIYFLFKKSMKKAKNVLRKDMWLLKLPLYGDLITKIYMGRFCKVFSVLSESGIDIIKTLHLASTALNNKVLFSTMKSVTDDVEEGTDFYTAMSKHPVFPLMVTQMIAVGEESGQLANMMEKVSDFYQAETQHAIKKLSAKIEPLLLLGMGLVVGFIALAIFSPMWGMMDAMKGG